MNAPAKIKAAEPGLPMLRDPFPDNQISKLPKETKAQIEARRNDKSVMLWKCAICGGAHHKDATHLDYVGHAALTDRLLDTDIEWSWEPVAFTTEGLPAFDRTGGLWIKLTVCGVSRLGYGAADGKSGGDAVKEIIGDALRNAAMRFGAALDLWHKGDLHADDDDTTAAKPAAAEPVARPDVEYITDDQRDMLMTLATSKGIDARTFCKVANVQAVKLLPANEFDKAKGWIDKQKPRAARSQDQAATVLLDDEIPY